MAKEPFPKEFLWGAVAFWWIKVSFHALSERAQILLQRDHKVASFSRGTRGVKFESKMPPGNQKRHSSPWIKSRDCFLCPGCCDVRRQNGFYCWPRSTGNAIKLLFKVWLLKQEILIRKELREMGEASLFEWEMTSSELLIVWLGVFVACPCRSRI